LICQVARSSDGASKRHHGAHFGPVATTRPPYPHPVEDVLQGGRGAEDVVRRARSAASARTTRVGLLGRRLDEGHVRPAVPLDALARLREQSPGSGRCRRAAPAIDAVLQSLEVQAGAAAGVEDDLARRGREALDRPAAVGLAKSVRRSYSAATAR
jgi:hypothetical protein